MTSIARPIRARGAAAALAVVALAAAGIVATPITAQAAAVDFAGTGALKSCVAAALSVSPSSTISAAQLADPAFTTLNCSYDKLTLITPLQYATNLKQVNLSGNNISDVTALSGLIKLKSLDLSVNDLTTIAPLASLEQLSTLDIGGNDVSDIGITAGMPLLSTLDITNNAIADISVLDAHYFTDLSLGDLGSTAPLDLSMLSGQLFLKKLTLNGPQITSLAAIAGRTNITQLILSQTGVTDFAPVKTLTNLTTFGLMFASEADVSFIADLHKLTGLLVYGVPLRSGLPISGLTQLQHLELMFCELAQLPSMAALTKLAYLHLDYNSLTDLTPAAGLPALTDFSATKQSVTVASAPAGTATTLPAVHAFDNALVPVTVTEGPGTVAGANILTSGATPTTVSWNTTVAVAMSQTGKFSGTLTQGVAESVPVPVPVVMPELPVAAPVVVAVPSVAAAPAPLTFAKKLTVTIKGAAKIGKTLKLTVTAPADGVRIAYQWYRNGKAIKKATKATYTVTATSKRSKLTVRVSASKPGYLTVTAKSKATSRVR